MSETARPDTPPGTADRPVRPDRQPGDRIGPYKLLEPLGEGGMGEVWAAEQTDPVRRKVAVKLIKPGMDSKSVLARFEAERQALALMDHPNIAKVLDAGTTPDGRPFFVMELVKGVPVTKFCDAKKLTTRQRLELFVPICQAVQHAHQKGVIHRDLKPSNILVSEIDGKAVPKVIDFGVAKAISQPLTDLTLNTGLGSVVGTPAYMAPEQAGRDALDVDTRADVYSLGVVLYELLAGRPPFDPKELRQAGAEEMLRVVREVDPPRPSTRLSGGADTLSAVAAARGTDPTRLVKLVRGDVEWVVMKCLEKDRGRRYETANGLAADVLRYLADEPVVARPPSVGYRMRKFVRRNRGQVIAASLVMGALLAGIVGTTLGLIRAEARRAEAELAGSREAERAEGERLAKIEAQQERDDKAEALRAEAEQRRRADDNAKRATAEKERAETEKRLAESVRDFLLHKLLGLADVRRQATALAHVGAPAGRAHKDRTIRELLDQAAKELTPDRIDANFPEQPRLQAEILQTVGNAYRGVGEFTLAVGFLERSVALWRQKSGGEDLPTLKALQDLALAHQNAGALSEAIRLLVQVRDAEVKKLGEGNSQTWHTIHNLARTYQLADKLPEAIRLYEQVRDSAAKQFAPEHPLILATLNNLALAYKESKRLPEAIQLYERNRAAFATAYGPDHPDTLAALNNLAGAYQATGDLPAAIRLFEQIRETWEKSLGPDHPDTLAFLNNLAMAYRDSGKLPDAIRLFGQVCVAVEKKLGPDHPSTLVVHNNLALALHAAGNPELALPLFIRAAEGIERRKFIDQHAGQIVGNVGVCHEQLRQYDRAEVWRRKWLAVVKARDGVDSLPYAGALAVLANNLFLQKKWVEAEPVLRACLTIRMKQRPDDWATFNTQSCVGRALLGQKKYADAEPLVLAGYEGMKAREKAIPPQANARVPEALDWLIELSTATNKPEEANRYRALRAAYPPERAPPPRPVPVK